MENLQDGHKFFTSKVNNLPQCLPVGVAFTTGGALLVANGAGKTIIGHGKELKECK